MVLKDAYPWGVHVRGHVQALFAQSHYQLYTIDGHHIGQDVLVERHADDILCTSWHTVALHRLLLEYPLLITGDIYTVAPQALCNL